MSAWKFAALAVFTPAVSLAEEPASESGIDVTTAAPAPEPPVARTERVHDGFYLRVGLGTGALGVSLDDDVLDSTLESSGMDLALDLRIAGTPSAGLVIGGALFAHALPSAKLESNGRDTGLDPSIGVGLLGPFIEGFPDPRGGFYLGGCIGLARVQYSELGPASERRESSGFGGAAWLGYDIWVAEQWSLGPSLRLTSTITRDTADGADLTTTTRGLTLTLSGLYH